MKPILSSLRRFRADQGGAAAVEFALWLSLTLYPLLNVVDFAMYAYERTQVENSAQMAVQVASTACGQQSAIPVLTYCSNLPSMMNASAQSTSLGSQVTVVARYECNAGSVTVNSAGGANPACPSTSGDYVGVAVTYTYTPLFHAATVASLLGTSISRTYWTRVA
jgi:Flp pilus assembly protein TadG